MYQQLFELHADLLKSLANSKRLEIVQLLRDQEMCVTDMYSMLDLPQAAVSQQLMILRDAGVVETTKKGKQVYYRLAHPNFIAASDLLREILIEKEHTPSVAKSLRLPMSELVPLVHDPVCQMRLSPKTAGFAETFHDHTYYFCASGCVKLFKQEPEKYVTT